jgi:hypothetical protein
MTGPAASTQRAHVWIEPPSGRRYLIVGEQILDGLVPLPGWRYHYGRGCCLVCDGWTRARDPEGRILHPSCASILAEATS